MFPVIGKCPVCGETMTVTRLHCRTCDSALEGPVSYTHLRAHETPEHLVCRLLLEKKNNNHK